MRKIRDELKKNLYKEINVDELNIKVYTFDDSHDYNFDVTFQTKKKNECELVVHKEYFDFIFEKEADYKYLVDIFVSRKHWYGLINVTLFYVAAFLVLYKTPLFLLYHIELPDMYYFQIAKIVLGWLYILLPILFHYYLLICDAIYPPLNERAIFFKMQDDVIKKRCLVYDSSMGVPLSDSYNTRTSFEKYKSFKGKIPFTWMLVIALIVGFNSFTRGNGLVEAFVEDNNPERNISSISDYHYYYLESHYQFSRMYTHYEHLRGVSSCGEYICSIQNNNKVVVYDSDMQLNKSFELLEGNYLRAYNSDYVVMSNSFVMNDQEAFIFRVYNYDREIVYSKVFYEKIYVLDLVNNDDELFIFVNLPDSSRSIIVNKKEDIENVINLDVMAQSVPYQDDEGFVLSSITTENDHILLKYGYEQDGFYDIINMGNRNYVYYHDGFIYQSSFDQEENKYTWSKYNENLELIDELELKTGHYSMFNQGFIVSGYQEESIVVYNKDFEEISKGLITTGMTIQLNRYDYLRTFQITDNKMLLSYSDYTMDYEYLEEVHKSFIQENTTGPISFEWGIRYVMITSVYLPVLYLYFDNKKNPSF